ncbi:MAG: phospholipid/glycerol acyltransferase [Bacteroidetes bacterium]|nr:phospholipid/glycerol acyltransferase [Bacteroidota bacterium]
MKVIFQVYLWIIAMPVLLLLTLITAILTLILSPVLPNSRISYFPARWWSKIICLLCFVKVKTNGFDHLDRKQSYIFIANHQSIFDIFAVYGWFPFIFKWLMKANLRSIPFVGAACAATGHIFIDRSNPVSARKSLLIAEKQLINGNSVFVFPEGTRTTNGAMNKFKRGAFLMASDLHLPVVPVTLSGSFERHHKHSLRITPGIITMTIHQPISPAELEKEKSADIIQKTWNIINNTLFKS